jgi:hypothetical protein
MTIPKGPHQGKERAKDIEISKLPKSATSKGDIPTPPTKLLGEWDKEEVQAWFLWSKFEYYAKKFYPLDGKDLAGLTKEDFLRRCPEMGDVIYNALQELKGDKGLEYTT